MIAFFLRRTAKRIPALVHAASQSVRVLSKKLMQSRSMGDEVMPRKVRLPRLDLDARRLLSCSVVPELGSSGAIARWLYRAYAMTSSYLQSQNVLASFLSSRSLRSWIELSWTVEHAPKRDQQQAQSSPTQARMRRKLGPAAERATLAAAPVRPLR